MSAAATAQAENALSHKALEIVAPYDAEELSEDLAGIFEEICEKYFANEAVLTVLEQEEFSANKKN